MIKRNPEALARRELRLVEDGREQAVLVEIGPINTQAHATSCRVRIADESSEMNREIHGVDAVQALQLAMKYAGSTLNRVAEPGSYFISGQDEPGHGFGDL